MKTAYLALGSNLGDRSGNLAEAAKLMACDDLKVVRSSSIFETEPRGLVNQPWFLNQVVEVETGLFPRQLLHRLRKIELEMGRKPSVPNGPRLIDLDILFYATAVVKTPELEIPHPRLAERRFVLEPLAEIAPDLKHPVTKRSVREMLAAVAGQKVTLQQEPPPPDAPSQS